MRRRQSKNPWTELGDPHIHAIFLSLGVIKVSKEGWGKVAELRLAGKNKEAAEVEHQYSLAILSMCTEEFMKMKEECFIPKEKTK